jgi:hypothetical protein
MFARKGQIPRTDSKPESVSPTCLHRAVQTLVYREFRALGIRPKNVSTAVYVRSLHYARHYEMKTKADAAYA